MLQKLNKRDCFCLHSKLHFLLHFWLKNWFTREIYDLTLCLAHFFEKDHLLKLIILGVYAKRWPKCARISKQKLMWPKIWFMIFLPTLTVRGPRKLCRQNLTKAEAATSSYSAAGDFLQYSYSVILAKNHRKIRSWCLVY